ncbi:hypothetical protein CH295_26430 [Rhodococcus sp. 14-2483-1-2]|nr:hypothetical protein CH295_26430 [Rhodococcus sp. 14-2483-1-2]
MKTIEVSEVDSLFDRQHPVPREQVLGCSAYHMDGGGPCLERADGEHRIDWRREFEDRLIGQG